MIVAFLVSWLPYAIVCFVKIAGYDVTPTVSALPLLCAKSSICWNPIIYVVLNEQVFFGQLLAFKKVSLATATCDSHTIVQCKHKK
jgi:hypothetical protein